MADFGAFVELEPGIEALAHVSTFAPTGRSGEWANAVAVGSTAAFEIRSIDTAQKRIGVALVEEGSSRAELREYATGRRRRLVSIALGTRALLRAARRLDTDQPSLGL